MARKLCTAGAVGSISFLILDNNDSAIASVRTQNNKEVVSRHVDVEHATNWTERVIRELNGKRYEVE